MFFYKLGTLCITLGYMVCIIPADTQKNDGIPVVPANAHPRLLLTEERCDALKQWIHGDDLFATAWQQITEMTSPDGADILLLDGAYNEAVLTQISAQAMRYAIEQDSINGLAAIKNIRAFHNDVVFSEAKAVTRAHGYAIFCTALVYDWCYPLLTSADKTALIAGIKTNAAVMEIGWPPEKQSDITGHAGEAQLLRDLLSAGIALYDEEPEFYNICADRFFNRMVPPRNFFYQSHRHHQGSHYGPYRFHWEMYSAWLFGRMNGTHVYSREQQFVPYEWIYTLCPDNRIFIDGDSAKAKSLFNVQNRALLESNYYNDPYVRYLAQRLSVTILARTKSIDFLLFYDPAAETATGFSDLPLTRYFAEPLGGMVVRTGWDFGSDSESAVIKMNGAGYFFGNHDHVDAGHFQIYYKGHLAIDTGIYGGGSYSSAYNWSINNRSIAHNVMLAYDPDETFPKGGNDGGQALLNYAKEPQTYESLLADYRNGRMLAHDFGPNKQRPFYSTMSVDLTEAYSKKIEPYQRRFVTLNLNRPGLPAALLVYDRMETANPDHKKYWLFQSFDPAEIRADGFTVTNRRNSCSGKVFCSTLLPSAGNLTMENTGGETGTHTVFGQTIPNANSDSFSQGWRLMMSPVTPAKLDRFLNVMQIMDADFGAPLPVEKISTPGFTGAKIENWYVLFPDGNKPVENDFAVSFPAESGNTWFLITGLKTGDWFVSGANSGTAIKHCIDENSDTLFWIGNSGNYAVSRSLPADCAEIPAPDLAALTPENHSMTDNRVYLDNALLQTSLHEQNDGTLWTAPENILIAAGVDAAWNGREFSAGTGSRMLNYKAGAPEYFLNGEAFTLPENSGAPETMLPLPALASFLKRQYIKESQNVVLLKPYPAERNTYLWYEQISADRSSTGQEAQYAADGDLKTYWAGEGIGAILTIDLGKTTEITAVKIAWQNGARRKAFFSLETSRDGSSWKEIFNGESDGKTAGFEKYSFNPVPARFVRLIGNGNNINGWNSVQEIEIVPVEK
ncbi:MAG: discoidin domain-containing protein [Kiritimatiellales bacterium]